jgi:hypothetical protein
VKNHANEKIAKNFFVLAASSVKKPSRSGKRKVSESNVAITMTATPVLRISKITQASNLD